MSIQKKIIVRYRAEGHVRFEIPEQICELKTAKIFTRRALELEGVYRVDLFRKQKKLSIRYHDVVCDFSQLAAALFKLIKELEAEGLFLLQVIEDTPPLEQKNDWDLKNKVKQWSVSKWVVDKYGDVKDTAKAAKIIAKIGIKKQKTFIKNPEQAIVDFLNDVLVLYLIRLHWVRITQEWLVRPWAFKSQWAAVFYLFYLLVRSRKPAKK